MAKLGTGSAKHHPAVERALQQLKAHWVQVGALQAAPVQQAALWLAT